MSRTREIRGFTLLEVLVATVLVGMAVAALLGASTAHTMVNDAGTRLSTAEFLVEQLRERTAALPVVEPGTAKTDYTSFGPEEGAASLYDDVDDFDGAAFSPPVDAAGQPLAAFGAYSQHVVVEKIDPANFDTVRSDTYATDFVRVTVTIRYQGNPISSASWIRARY